MADADGAETDDEGLYAFCICHLRLSLGGREDTFQLPFFSNKAIKKTYTNSHSDGLFIVI